MNTDTFDVLEEFTCHLYGHKQNDVHEIIKLHVEEKAKANCFETPLGNIISVEPRTFSLCRTVLIKGSNLLTVTWFEGQQVPQEIEDVQVLDESDDEAMEYDSDEEENGSDIDN